MNSALHSKDSQRFTSLEVKDQTPFHSTNQPVCPITKDPHCQVLETVSTQLLIDCYRQDLGIDVTEEFDGIEHLQLCRGLQSDVLFFHPTVAGSPTFYQKLRAYTWYSPPSKFEYECAAALVKTDDHVLDIGCGTGHFAKQVPLAQYSGLEPSLPTQTTTILPNGTIYSEHLSYHADAHRESYDAVCAFQVLEHVVNPTHFVELALTCLKPTGLLILGVPSAESYLTHLTNFVLNAPPHHVTWWTDQALRCLAAHCNLEVQRITHAPVESWERQLYWMERLSSGLSKPSQTYFSTSSSHRWRNIGTYLLGGMLGTLRSTPSSARGASVVLITKKRP